MQIRPLSLAEKQTCLSRARVIRREEDSTQGFEKGTQSRSKEERYSTTANKRCTVTCEPCCVRVCACARTRASSFASYVCLRAGSNRQFFSFQRESSSGLLLYRTPARTEMGGREGAGKREAILLYARISMVIQTGQREKGEDEQYSRSGKRVCSCLPACLSVCRLNC